MAFDGFTVAAIVHELNSVLIEGRINKIAQPEKDELLLTIKASGNQYRLLLSANPSLPLCYLTDENKVSPQVAPAFTMLLRKHLNNARIISITQPDFERIIDIELEHLNELGDVCTKHLIVELMGKYSNIIFIDDNNKILDSIKRVNAMTSSVREVLPGCDYFVPHQEGRVNPMAISRQEFESLIASRESGEIYKVIYQSLVGMSPMQASELCVLAGVEPDTDISKVRSSEALGRISDAFASIMMRVRKGDFTPVILLENGVVKDYSMVDAPSYSSDNRREAGSPSKLIEGFYKEKETINRSRAKSADLRKIVSIILERDSKKYDIQLKQLKDTEKMEKYRIYGELLHTYGYGIEEGAKSARLVNYYDGEEIVVPLDETLSAMENAKKYFDKYGKLKRTREALETLTVEVKEEIDHLQSIMNALEFATKEEDINEIKEEMIECGYIRRKGGRTKLRFKSRPLHYVSSDGFDIYVGKNNYQNDELTFKVANGGDWWFHAKGIPGSHVIVKTEGRELPDKTFEEAGRLAAHYSKGSKSEKVEIDYLKRKDVKKPNGSKPGFVVYYTNYSMMSYSDIEGIKAVEET